MRNNLYTLLKADEKQVRKIILKVLEENGYSPIVHKDFIYAEGTIPVLLLAHYDTVAESPRFIVNKGGVLSGRVNKKPHQLGADDRAGIYAVLETIVKHHCHVLFTGGEETGGIGAQAFTYSGIKPDVNYCIQLDRRGVNDAVYYDGDNKEFEEFITEHGWETNFGSFTDICVVCPYLEVSGVNLSIGYEHEHTTEETLDTNVMNMNIKRIPELLNGEKFEWIEAEFNWPEWFRGVHKGGYSDSLYDDYEDMYCIYYIGKDGEEHSYEVFGYDFYSAVGRFMSENDSVTYSQVVAVIPDSEYSFFSADYK